jgi:hypothetical protein
MKGDFSRIRFNPAKNYTAVLQQQGRVALDADANEQSAIEAYLRERTNVDVIGRYGGPQGDVGFAIEIVAGKIWIGAGRYYVDGILVHNSRRRRYDDQSFYLSPSPDESALLTDFISSPALQFQLQVWRRLVTELDDPCLVEPAVGQADTTVRLQTCWRVIATPINNDQASQSPDETLTGLLPTTFEPTAGSSNCKSPIPNLSACCQSMYPPPVVPRTGSMSAQTPTAGNDCGCQPIPAAGYQGLENQLYRVEIHAGGDLSAATFKWSRENGSVVTKITAINGAALTCSSLGPDANLGFQAGQWVELTDDDYLFGDTINRPGTLYKIASLGPDALQVTLNASVPILGANRVDTKKNARMRRWEDASPLETGAGIPLSTAPIPLENGIEVAFKAGSYVSGDYWTIPARTSTGQIDWSPCGGDDDAYKLARYFAIYVAPLACIYGPKRTPQGVKDAQAPAETLIDITNTTTQDCRLKFPPLTSVSCGDSGPCTIVPRPGAGWEAPLLALKKGADADICFPIGTFPLTAPLVLTGMGHIRMTGGGPGTKIVATRVSAAMVFAACASVEISDLYVSTDTARIRNQRGKENPPLGGTLSFQDCADVTVEKVSLQCGFTEQRVVSCIAVQNTPLPLARVFWFGPPPSLGTGWVRVLHCNLSVGRNQNGILLVNVNRAQVEDNILVAYTPKKPVWAVRVQNRAFRASLIRQLVGNAVYVKAATATQSPAPAAEEKNTSDPAAPLSADPATTTPAPAPADAKSEQAQIVEVPIKDIPTIHKVVLNVDLTVGNASIAFRTHPSLKNFWGSFLAASGPKTFTSNRDLLLYIKQAASNFVLQPKLRKGNSALTELFASFDRADQIAMARGISVGGEGIQECRIVNNAVRDAVHPITVGMSNHKTEAETWLSATVVTIAGNQVYVGLPPGVRPYSPHAIFVGNVDSLMVENNTCGVIDNPNQIPMDAVSIWGLVGRRAIVRHCHLAGFDPGITFSPIAPVIDPAKWRPLWLVADNLAEGAAHCVEPNFPTPIVLPKIFAMWVNNLSIP